jgi:hypothetical protein
MLDTVQVEELLKKVSEARVFLVLVRAEDGWRKFRICSRGNRYDLVETLRARFERALHSST